MLNKSVSVDAPSQMIRKECNLISRNLTIPIKGLEEERCKVIVNNRHQTR
jgi:hypothetical protein